MILQRAMTMNTMWRRRMSLNNSSRWFCKFSINKDLLLSQMGYEYCKPVPDLEQAEFLEKLAHCQVKSLSENVDIISFDKQIVSLKGLGSDQLFVRKFYSDMLELIRKNERSVLIGNPGIGKSFFQFYYLARIMNPHLLGPLPPDCYGSTDPPRVVIRQEGTSLFVIYDIANRKADEVSGNGHRLLKLFDPETSLYLMEPERSLIEPYFGGLQIPTLTTVSPNLARYKEFCKNGGVKVYMPIFDLPDLLVIGKHLLVSGAVPEDLKAEYTTERIKSRFEKYGGIMRHVLPLSLSYIDECDSLQEKAIEDCDAKALLASGDIEKTHISHFIMQYKVSIDGMKPFREIALDVMNDYVLKKIEAKARKVSLDERKNVLLKNDEVPTFMADMCAKIYESVIADLLTSEEGVLWTKRQAKMEVKGKKKSQQEGEAKQKEKKEDVKWVPFNLKLKATELGTVPSFANMKPFYLYVSLNSTFPFFDSMYKTDQDELVGIQITRQKGDIKICKLSALQECLERIEFPDDKIPLIKTVLVPSPSKAATSKLKMNMTPKKVPEEVLEKETEEEKKVREARVEQLKHVLDYEVWNVPKNYGSIISVASGEENA